MYHDLCDCCVVAANRGGLLLVAAATAAAAVSRGERDFYILSITITKTPRERKGAIISCADFGSLSLRCFGDYVA